jgi:hypothetical protein
MAELEIKKAEESVCNVYANTVIDCVVCIDPPQPPFGISDLKGKLCEEGALDCSQCVDNMERQSESIDLSSRDGTFRFERIPRLNDAGLGDYVALGFTTVGLALNPISLWNYFDIFKTKMRVEKFVAAHIQGVGRLRDWNGKGRLVMTESSIKDPRGIHIAFQDVGSTEAIFGSNDAKKRKAFRITAVNEYGNHGHPGGLQAHGDFVAVAMEQGKFPAVYFLKVTGNTFEFLHSLMLDGSGGAKVPGGAASAGFIRLSNGWFLVSIAGAKNGTEGIWFYISKGGTLNADTEWEYAAFLLPGTTICNDAKCVRESLFKGSESTYFGAGGALNLVADCNGEIYLIALGGECTTTRCNGQWYQVFKVTWVDYDPESYYYGADLIHLELVYSNYANHNKIPTKEISFRFGAGVIISPDHQLVLMGTERKHFANSNDYVDGNLYYSRPTQAGHPTCPTPSPTSKPSSEPSLAPTPKVIIH